MELTVGDHSGSYSERWVLHVGARNFQNEEWGTVVSTTYTYGPGEYDIVLEHRVAIQSTLKIAQIMAQSWVHPKFAPKGSWVHPTLGHYLGKF